MSEKVMSENVMNESSGTDTSCRCNKDGWVRKKLAEVCETFIDGDWIESKDQADRGIRLIQTGNVGEGIFKDKSESQKFISEETFKALNCTEIYSGDVLISRLPEPIGRSCIIPNLETRLITAVDCSIIRLRNEVLPQFFVYYTLSEKYNLEIQKHVTGAVRKRISRKNLGSISCEFPPISEQRRIVSELDCLNGIIEKQKEQLKQLDELAQSIFYDMFGDPVENEKGWKVSLLKDITSKIGSGATPKGGNESYKDYGISLIRSLNVHNNLFKEKDLAFIDEEQADGLKNVIVQKDDVLLNITGASVARCCIVPESLLPARVNQHVAILRPLPDRLNSYFLSYLLTSLTYQQLLLMQSRSNGATREALTKTQLQNLKIVCPPFPLQQSFAQKIEAIERQKELIKQSIAETETLFNSRMDYYFE